MRPNTVSVRTGIRLPRIPVVGAAACFLFLMVAASAGSAQQMRSPFELQRFFSGRTFSKGSVTTALVSTQEFTATFEGRGRGKTLDLDEHFHFPDGDPSQHWHLLEVAPGSYAGQVRTELKDGTLAPAVPVFGQADERGIVLDYDGYAPGGGRTELHFRHAMTPQPDGTVANHVTISKFGVPIATSDVVFAKDRAALAHH